MPLIIHREPTPPDRIIVMGQEGYHLPPGATEPVPDPDYVPGEESEAPAEGEQPAEAPVEPEAPGEVVASSAAPAKRKYMRRNTGVALGL